MRLNGRFKKWITWLGSYHFNLIFNGEILDLAFLILCWTGNVDGNIVPDVEVWVIFKTSFYKTIKNHKAKSV